MPATKLPIRKSPRKTRPFGDKRRAKPNAGRKMRTKPRNIPGTADRILAGPEKVKFNI